MIWRTLNELSPSSTTSPSVLSTPPWSQEQWLRGLPLSQFPLSIPRVNFKTFLVYSVFNVIIYAIPASWLFSQDGWLKQLGGIDYGCGVVDPTQFLKNLSSSILSFALNRWCIWLVGSLLWLSPCTLDPGNTTRDEQNPTLFETGPFFSISMVSGLDSSTAQRQWLWETQHFA